MHDLKPVKDIELTGKHTVSQMVDDFASLSFNARKLARASELWLDALNNNARVYLSLAAAMTPAGMRRVVARMMEEGLIHIIVTTGSNAVHDALQALYKAHRIGTEFVNDLELKEKKTMRIHDTYLANEYWDKLDKWLENEFYMEYAQESDSELIIKPPSEFFRKIGEYLHNKDDNGMLATAYAKNIPVYSPAYIDSDLGISLDEANEKLKPVGKRIIVDPAADFNDLILDIQKTPLRAAIMIGGGTPKNFLLQSGISLKNEKDWGFDYGVQLTTDLPVWGGLSGATLREAISWGKMRTENSVTVYSDATITLPLLVESVLSKYKK